MNKNKRPSGADFRKRRKENEEKARKHPKIKSFFQSESVTNCSSSILNYDEINFPKDANIQHDTELTIEESEASVKAVPVQVNENEMLFYNNKNSKAEADSNFQENINFLSSKSYSSIPKVHSFFQSEPVTSRSSSVSNYNDICSLKNADAYQDSELVLEKSEASITTAPVQIKERESCSYNYEKKAKADSDVHENINFLPNNSETGSTKFNHKTSDIGLFSENDILKEDVKVFILNSKPCKPQGPFPKDEVTKRSFSSDFYYNKTKTGHKIERFWLCYSPTLNGVYCEPCWLFADRADPHFKNAWCKGTVNDWKGLSKKIKEHEMSQVHINACLTYSIRKNQRDVQSMLQKDLVKWKEILKRILDVVITMATCNLAFRGHRDENVKNIGSKSGNFLNIIELLTRYDPLLKSHLENDKNKTKYLSPAIQNDMIELASKQVLNKIISEIQEAPFFSLIIDTTQDCSKVDQMSMVIRHVSIKQRENVLEVKESFLGFIALSDQNAESIDREVCTFLENSNISIEKCRGQGYDGASVMSGQYAGLQTRIKEKSNNAEYVHCAAHNLNLVLNDSVNNITEMIVFYSLINQIYVYFSESLPRWQSLRKFSQESCIIQKTLKRLCPTRWSSRYDCLLSVKVNFTNILNCLSKIILVSLKRAEIVEATGLRKQMTSFNFVLMLVFQSKILERVNVTSKALQNCNISLDEAMKELERSLLQLMEMRNAFGEIVEEAQEMSKTWNIEETTLPSKRKRRVKTFFDELSEDFEFKDPLQNFRIRVFNRVLDTLVCEINRRFKSMRSINDNFNFLSPKHLIEKTDKELAESAKKFYNKYKSDVSNAIESEILCFRNIVSQEIVKRKLEKISEIANFFFIENKILSCSLPNVCTALVMFLTLPVTTATAERSFSKLKLIKNYLRSTMSSMRLNGLAILSIENERARAIDLSKLAEEFASSKNRKRLMNI